MKKIYLYLGAFVALLGLIWVVSAQSEKVAVGGFEELNHDIVLTIEHPPYEGKDHIEVGDPTPDYETFPPTSGPHSPLTEEYGFYESTLAIEKLVHNLEHGDIVIYYSPQLTEGQQEDLKRLAGLQVEHSGVIAHPYELEHEIVLTAWERRLSLEQFDIVQIEQFIYDHIATFDHGVWLDESVKPER